MNCAKHALILFLSLRHYAEEDYEVNLIHSLMMHRYSKAIFSVLLQLRTSIYLLKDVELTSEHQEYEKEDVLRFQSPGKRPLSKQTNSLVEKNRNGKKVYKTLPINTRETQVKDTGEKKKKKTLEDIFISKKDVLNLANMAEFGLKDLCISYEAKNSLGTGMEQEMGVLAHQNQLTKGFDGNQVLS